MTMLPSQMICISTKKEMYFSPLEEKNIVRKIQRIFPWKYKSVRSLSTIKKGSLSQVHMISLTTHNHIKYGIPWGKHVRGVLGRKYKWFLK